MRKSLKAGVLVVGMLAFLVAFSGSYTRAVVGPALLGLGAILWRLSSPTLE